MKPAHLQIRGLSAGYGGFLVLRDLDNMLLPTRGTTLSLQLGAGQARSSQGETGPFGRLHGRLTSYWPLGAQWYGSARVEAGRADGCHPGPAPVTLTRRTPGHR